jgi:hypothetical protein
MRLLNFVANQEPRCIAVWVIGSYTDSRTKNSPGNLAPKAKLNLAFNYTSPESIACFPHKSDIYAKLGIIFTPKQISSN